MSGMSALSSTESSVSVLRRRYLFRILPMNDASLSVQSLSQSMRANSSPKLYSSPVVSCSCSNNSRAFLRKGCESSSCSGDSCKRTKPNRTRRAASVDSGLTASHSASTAGHLPCLRSHATDRLEVLQSMRDKAPMPHLQHSISWEELLPQLRHNPEVVETRHIWPTLANGQR